MSTFISACLLALTLLLRSSPDTDLSRMVRRLIVENPCSWWLTLSRRDAIHCMLLIFVLLSAGELMLMLGSVDLVLAYAFDLSFYLDAVMASGMIAAAVKVRSFSGAIRGMMLRRPTPVRSRARQKRRSVSAVRSVRGANDEDGPVRWAA
ncbi:MAG: hypothetical protein ACKOUT_04980 [Novosphingobium sp.]